MPIPHAHVRLGDLDHDGHPDLIVPISGETMVMLRGKGDGSFELPEASSFVAGQTVVVAADLDENGLDDLVSVAPGGQDLLLHLAQPGGGFSSFLAGVRLNNITRVVVSTGGRTAVLDQGGRRLVLLRRVAAVTGASGGFFASPTTTTLPTRATDLAFSGLAGAGKPASIVIVFAAENLAPAQLDVYSAETGERDPSFHRLLAPSGDPRLAVGDFDGDGLPDLVILGTATLDTTTARPRLRTDGYVDLYRNSGGVLIPNGHLVGEIAAKGIAIGDFDGDHRPDLAIQLPESTLLLRQSGSGFIASETATPLVADLLAVDLNGDGADELVSAGNSPTVMQYDPYSGGLRVEGPYAIGPTGKAPVALKAAGGEGMRLVFLDALWGHLLFVKPACVSAPPARRRIGR
jgi:hypothetical protein